ncbi:hypothetical protein [Gordonia sp. NPDC003950]
MRTGATDLDDVEELIAADSEGLLHAAALAGAQVRSVAEAIREGVTESLAELRPRSVVVVSPGGGAAAAATAMITAVMATRIDVPIVSAPGLPGWIGPLDVVVLAGDDGGDMILADAAARALRRRAEVVIAAPVEGPLRDALGGNGINLSPRIDVDPRFRFAGFVAILLAVLTSMGQVRFTGTAPEVADIADALDDEAAADHPGRETFHNHAKMLAARLGDGPMVWSGDSPATTALAGRASGVMFAVTGIAGAALDLADIGRVARDQWADAGSSSPADDIFYDPQIDGPRPDAPPRVVVTTSASREWHTRRRIEGIPTAEVVVGDGDDIDSGATASAAPLWPGTRADRADVPADLTSLLVLMLRIEMAAVYLRLTEAGRR